MKERLLRFTGFDLFERKYLLFLIPCSFAVPMVLLLRNHRRSTQNRSFFKIFLQIAARFFAYAIPAMILSELLNYLTAGAIRSFLSFVLTDVLLFLISVAWMGLVYDYTE